VNVNEGVEANSFELHSFGSRADKPHTISTVYGDRKA
jgi:hypothetical protein